MIPVFVISVFLLGVALGQDQTRVPGASGEEVVEAVVSRIRESCTFSHDKLFLRRLAYVETHDGTDPKTYRPGYDGGIWQVDESKFNLTKASSKAGALLPKIKYVFGIDWSITRWEDLRQPMFSGLAAALYLASLTEDIPQGTQDQATFYFRHFRNDNQSMHDFSEGSKRLDIVCQRTNLDLAFLVDASSSLAPEDFREAKRFAQNVVKNFKIGRNDVRIAFVTFSSGYKSQFDFNQYTNNDDVHKAIDQVLKSEGHTDTDQALDYASGTLFTNSSGSRVGSSKVILLVTDGKSTVPKKTLPAAIRTRNKGITVFAIGVGSDVDTEELRNLANKPQCTHVVTLAGYGDLSSLVGEIQEVSCKAPAVLTRGRHVYSCLNSGLYQIETNGSTAQVKIAVTDGAVSVYGSVINATPNKAGHDFFSISTPATASTLLMNAVHRPLYLNITASGRVNSCSGNYTIDIGNVERVNLSTPVFCVHRDVTRLCSVVDLYRNFFTVVEPPYKITNPCRKSEPGFKGHPTDQTKFIICGVDGTDNVFKCPQHHIYDQNIKDCIVGEPSTTTSTTTRTPAPITTIAAQTTTPSQPATTIKKTTFPSTHTTPSSIPDTTSTTFTSTTATPTTVSTTTINPRTTATTPPQPVTTKMKTTTFPSTSSSTTFTSTTATTTTASTTTINPPTTPTTPPQPVTTKMKTTTFPSTSSSTTFTSTTATTTTASTTTINPPTTPSTPPQPVTTKMKTTTFPSTSTGAATTPTSIPATTSTSRKPKTTRPVIQSSTKSSVSSITTKTPSESSTTTIRAHPNVASTTTPSTSSTVFPSSHPSTNPCTNETKGRLFPYPNDDAKYIDCSIMPNVGYVMTCQNGKTWDQSILTCTYKYVIVDQNQMTVDKNVHNPCRMNLHKQDLFYFPHPDKTKFIQCDQYGDAFVKACPKGEVWRQAVLQCIPSAF
ncbi:serine-rich adhesin for platelets-like [Haliotis rubra]|uniref:serine-rich adhesin for platelets-like n=1 Tax=Haliotis rubra TaxID=36100 RepID=UPI001EE52CC9|nr:serine-rich adhesin for platelets-like [Haliotis rubra]